MERLIYNDMLKKGHEWKKDIDTNTSLEAFSEWSWYNELMNVLGSYEFLETPLLRKISFMQCQR